MSDPSPHDRRQSDRRAVHRHTVEVDAAHLRAPTAEHARLAGETPEADWRLWGPYLAERQWGTVREDYSPDGSNWEYLPHEQARSRAYRWGEDGLLGICDAHCRLCFALALWNGEDRILKERLYGLTTHEGNHGEDVKECYWFLDAMPSSSYLAARYKYPQSRFPYEELLAGNLRRGRDLPEYELPDTGAFDGDRYFDVTVEYAKAAPEDILVRLTIENRGPDAAPLDLLPTLWFRNGWTFGRHPGEAKPRIARGAGPASLVATHPTLGTYRLAAMAAGPDGAAPELLFTENETNAEAIWGTPNASPYTKDAFHAYVVDGDAAAVNPAQEGSKAAVRYRLTIPGGGRAVVTLRLWAHDAAEDDADRPASGPAFDAVFTERMEEADAFYARRIPAAATPDERRVARQGYAGLLWSRQFYHYTVEEWLEGDPAFPAPPASRLRGRNCGWPHVRARDVIAMPDTWEYPWFAAWDLGFHAVAFGAVDPDFAKEQLLLLLREWYMHPSGQIPAYEFAFGDANPPVHAWACWRVYKMSGPRGARDRTFLQRAFHKLLINFTWWVNRVDPQGNNLFSGGFLGLDNIGVFDRNATLPSGQWIEQADATAWMAFYAATMLAMALELAREDRAYEDVAVKFFEHFTAIAAASNTMGGGGLWNEEDGFYYDLLMVEGRPVPLRVRSMVGIIPLFTCEVIDESLFERLPEFGARVRWFLKNRPELASCVGYIAPSEGRAGRRLLSMVSKERLVRILARLLDEREFLSPHGIRSLSAAYRDAPFVFRFDGQEHHVPYVPGESDTPFFGGNSNWRGPVWMPVNYLLVEALERLDHFYGDEVTVECPTGSGKYMTLGGVARELARRLVSLWLPDEQGRRPFNGGDRRADADPHWKDLLLFHEYFHGDSGRGLGASHQTGWTALVVRLIEALAQDRVTGTRSESADRASGVWRAARYPGTER